MKLLCIFKLIREWCLETTAGKVFPQSVNLSYYNVGPIIYYSFAGKL